MKKINLKKLIGIAMVVGISVGALAGCTNNTNSEDIVNEETSSDSSVEVENITVNTYVGDAGRMVSSVLYEIEDTSLVEDISSEDFTITIKEDEYNVIDIVVDENTLKLEVEDFSYEGIDDYVDGETTHYDFNVESTIEELAFTKEECELVTEIIDDFVQGSFTGSNGITLPYWIYMPENASDVPLMVWQHGGGEVLATSYEGANIVANKGATTWIEHGYETAVVSFQYPENYVFGISEDAEQLAMMEAYNELIYEFIQELIEEGQVDENRIYISGASSGGGATLRFVMQYPELFAAALPICAKDTIIPLSIPYDLAYKFEGDVVLSGEDYQVSYEEMTEVMKDYDIIDVPMWFVSAENDIVCTSSTSSILYDVLNDMGATQNKITLYTDEEMEAAGLGWAPHFSWEIAFNDEEIIEWIYSQSK